MRGDGMPELNRNKKCDLCKGPLATTEELLHGWDEGHNAAPFRGRCCKVCNDTLVVPQRIRIAFNVKERTQ
jgi:hypothetical protein